ncbi:MAG: PEP-CTERM sorting domain-containing protein [Phenylobacterium sp.]|uniref:PEPxxWA-CTERM sorting domain-containing protein n=1 Tax=Phenylobacterium sp. TaxID=1871053 RepID=UPI001A3C60B5|nr:PEPxxWA-CTERM sorting domain-containing protein [Phenylobacterium sp.]MBL8555026.1 PEP-CTERM sorting domain-containing protein [Phenylobacterium sp.]
MRFKAILLGGFAAAALAGTAQADVALYANDFDSAATLGAGITGGPISNLTLGTADTGSWNASGWSGNYGRNESVGPIVSSTLNLSGLAAHTTVTMSFVLGFLDSWDSTNGSPAPDYFEIYIDGAATPLSQMTANNAGGSVEDFDGNPIIAHYQQVDGRQFYSDTLIGYLVTFNHTGSTLSVGLRANGSGWQGGTDESWGIDNVNLSYNAANGGGGVPEPATWALMIGGFGLAGTALRRRRAVTA